MIDSVVEEVRHVRARIAEECGYDLRIILDHARKAAEGVPGLKYGEPQPPSPAQQGETSTAASVERR